MLFWFALMLLCTYNTSCNAASSETSDPIFQGLHDLRPTTLYSGNLSSPLPAASPSLSIVSSSTLLDAPIINNSSYDTMEEKVNNLAKIVADQATTLETLNIRNKDLNDRLNMVTALTTNILAKHFIGILELSNRVSSLERSLSSSSSQNTSLKRRRTEHDTNNDSTAISEQHSSSSSSSHAHTTHEIVETDTPINKQEAE